MIRIEPVDSANILQAAEVHAASWQASHRDICSAEFVAAHTPQRQADMIRRQTEGGKRFFLLTDGVPAGVVVVSGSVIEHLYVHPDLENRGYGSALLHYAIDQCNAAPTLWLLSSNDHARQFYLRRGFQPTGIRKLLRGDLWEEEMILVHFTSGTS